MKSAVCALVAICAAGVSAAKADSFYFGVHGGDGFLNDSWTLHGALTYTGTSSANGLIGGVQAGWMHDINNLAVGLEGDLSFANLHAGFDGFEGIGVNANMLSSLRLRAGLANGPIMPYVTAGVGLGSLKFTEEGTFYGSNGNSVDRTKLGLVVGGGLETKLTDNLSGRIEGLYYAFGNDAGSFADTRTYSVDSNVFVARVGLNYNFGP